MTSNPRIALRQAGFSLIETLIAVGLISIVAVGTFYLLALSASSERKADAWLDEYRTELRRALEDSVAWNNTLNDAVNSDPASGPLTCLRNRTDCSAATVPGGLRIRVVDRNGQVISDTSSPTTGLTVNGMPCNTFDQVNGDDACPYRISVWFSALCVTGCTNPEFLINARFFHRPRTNSQNVAVYNFRVYRNAMTDTVSATCLNQGGAFGTGQCTVDPAAPCPAGEAITGFDGNNRKICGQVAANYACPADEFLQGADDWGNPICSRCP